MMFEFVNPKTCKAKFKETRKAVTVLVQSNPVFLSRGGTKESVSHAFHANVEIDPEDDAADIRRQPFRLMPLSENPPNCYHIHIESTYYSDEPLYPGAPCSIVEFISVWAMAYKVLGFLAIPSKVKTEDDWLEERDTCLAFAYLYFGIEYEKITMA